MQPPHTAPDMREDTADFVGAEPEASATNTQLYRDARQVSEADLVGGAFGRWCGLQHGNLPN